MTFHQQSSLSSQAVADSSAAGSGAARAGRVTHGALGYVLAYGFLPLMLVAITTFALGVGAAICAACGWMLAMIAGALCDSALRDACAACEAARGDVPPAPRKDALLRDWARRNWGRPGSTDELVALASRDLGVTVHPYELIDCWIDLADEKRIEAMRAAERTRPGALCDAKA